MYQEILKLAIEQRLPAEQLELVSSQLTCETAKAEKTDFYAALCKFQAEIPVIEKKATVMFPAGNSFVKYSYARLEDIVESIKEPLKNNGLSFFFKQITADDKISVECTVAHISGHSERSTMSALADTSGKKNQIQQLASTVSYLRRYTLTGALGITVSEEDDNGEESDGFYPKDKFEAAFPLWKQQIEGGAKSVEQIFSFLGKKDIKLSPEQIEKVGAVGATNGNP